ncbi:MAG: hypothetical protein FWD61_18690 [Phycisphaerales bacterium]|nr:hypothetical protein [Phycisphaerales bacterium]
MRFLPAKRTRQEARERLLKLFEAELDRLVPADSAKPMKGKTFRDFEMQGVSFKPAMVPALLEELAGLDDSAVVESVARALKGKETPETRELGETLESLLYNGHVEQIIAWMKSEATNLGPPQPTDGPTHAREVLRQNIGYFEKYQKMFDK